MMLRRKKLKNKNQNNWIQIIKSLINKLYKIMINKRNLLKIQSSNLNLKNLEINYKKNLNY